MAWYDSIKNFLGLGSKGGGGDAFDTFKQYVGAIEPYVEQERQRLMQQGRNPYIENILASTNPLQAAQERLQSTISGVRSQAAGIGDRLRTSALASTAPAQQAAAFAARTAAGGRGGLGFGGGAGAIAARAAQGAATTQSSALANALLQGEQFDIGTQLQTEGMNVALAQAIAGQTLQAAGSAAGLEEQYRDRLFGLANADIQGRYGLASGLSMGGLRGEQATAGRRFQFGQQLLGIGQAVGSMVGM